VAALIAPTLTPSPPSPLAEVGGPSFAKPGGGAQLPLLLTAIGAQFAGDATTTNLGGIISLAPDGTLRMTLNNSDLGVNGIALGSGAKTSVSSGTFSSYVAPLPNTNSGSWFIRPDRGDPVGGVWSTGFSTLPASIPTASFKLYFGDVGGLISEYHISDGGSVGLVDGNLSLSANYVTRTISGSITGLRVGTDGIYRPGPVNNLSFTATFSPGTNTYTGEVVSGSSPGGPNAFQAGARGTISGQFFGPRAEEIGGVLTLSDGTSRLIISFSATNDL